MGCYTWVYQRGKEIEDKINNHPQQILEEFKTWILTKLKEVDNLPWGEDYKSESRIIYNKLLNNISTWDYKDVLRYYLLHVIKIVYYYNDDKRFYKGSKRFSNPFYYHDIDNQIELKSFKEACDFMLNVDNHCSATFDEDGEYKEYFVKEWTEEQKNILVERIRKIFECNPESLITFG